MIRLTIELEDVDFDVLIEDVYKRQGQGTEINKTPALGA